MRNNCHACEEMNSASHTHLDSNSRFFNSELAQNLWTDVIQTVEQQDPGRGGVLADRPGEAGSTSACRSSGRFQVEPGSRDRNMWKN